MQYKSRQPPCAGFTLVELVITMSVFAILVALTVPSMRVWVNNNKIRATADALQNGIRLAQTEALRQSTQVVFYQTNTQATQTSAPPAPAANGSGWVAYTMPPIVGGNSSFIAAGTLAGPSAGTSITSPGGNQAICLNSLGRLITASLTQIVLNGTSYSVAISCILPTSTGTTAPFYTYNITNSTTLTGTRPLNVEVALGGQIHMCDPAFSALASATPEGC